MTRTYKKFFRLTRQRVTPRNSTKGSLKGSYFSRSSGSCERECTNQMASSPDYFLFSTGSFGSSAKIFANQTRHWSAPSPADNSSLFFCLRSEFHLLSSRNCTRRSHGKSEHRLSVCVPSGVALRCRSTDTADNMSAGRRPQAYVPCKIMAELSAEDRPSQVIPTEVHGIPMKLPLSPRRGDPSTDARG